MNLSAILICLQDLIFKKFASGGFKLLEGSKLYTQNDSEYVYKASSLKKFAVGGFRRKQVTHQNSRPILLCLEGLFSKTIASGGFRRKPFTHQEWLLEPSLYDWKAYFFYCLPPAILEECKLHNKKTLTAILVCLEGLFFKKNRLRRF